MLQAKWSDVLRSDLDKLSQLSTPKKAQAFASLKEGERRFVTVLFLDIRGFTAMSEKLDPEDVQLIIDNCFKILTNEIERYHGYIDKYEGDRMMALFGSREASDQDCERALRAALGMQQKFNEINQILSEREIEIGIRIGVNAGLVVTGRIGKGRDQDFTVMGDAVNTASRLESNAPPGEIMIGEDVKQITGDVFVYESLGDIKVKGKTEALSVYTVKGLNPKRAERWERSPFTKRSVYVPRKQEHDAVESAYKKLLEDEGVSTLAFSAQAGVGKSRLVHESLKELSIGRSEDSYVFRITTTSRQGQPLGIFANFMRQVLANKSYSDGLSEELLPVVRFISGDFEPDDRMKSLEPKSLQLELHLTIRKVMEHLSKKSLETYKKPLVVAFEDLQWADPTSVEVLQFLAAGFSEGFRCLLLWTYRPDFVPPKDVVEGLNVLEFHLEPLSEKDTGEILKNVLGDIQLSARDRKVLIKRSGGNPFFMEELIQSLVDDGTLVEGEGSWKLTKEIDESQLPHSVNRILLGRIDKLENAQKQTLMAGAVIGETIPREVLFRVLEKLGFSKEDMDLRLQSLENMGFVFEKKTPGPLGPELSFRHALTRDVVYSTLLNHNKKILHELTGEALETIYSDRSSEQASILYRHFYSAGVVQKAVSYGRMAVEQMLRRHSSKEGLKLIEELRSIQDDFEVNIRLSDTEIRFYDFLGNRSAQLKAIEQLEGMASSGEKKLGARVAHHRATYAIATADYKSAKDYASKGLAEMGEDGKVSKLRMDLHRTLGIAHYSTGDYPTALENYQKGLLLAEKLKDKNAEGRFYNAIGIVNFDTGDLSEALRFYQRTHKIMTEIGDRHGTGSSVGNQGLIHLALGEYSRALRAARESNQIFRDIGFKRGHVATLGNIGVILHKLGQYSEALKCYEEAFQLRKLIQDRAGESSDLVNIGLTYLHLGKYDRAIEYFDKGERIAREVGRSYLLAINLNCMAIVYRKLGEKDQALLEKAHAVGEEALKVAIEHDLVQGQVNALSNLGRTKLLLGKPEEAFEFSTKAMDIIRTRKAGVGGTTEEDAYINHYHISSELKKDDEAKETLEIMVNLIQDRASKIEEEPYRKSFLESVRQNRYALAEWKGMNGE